MERADTLFLEPFSGLAGDMLLAALLDLRDPRLELGHLRQLADALVPGECRLETERVWRGALSGLMLTVRTPESAQLPHRALAECERLIAAAAPLSPAAKARAGRIFRRIAEAEGRVHGCAPEEVHFHEVGAVDSLVDVCGAAFALERLEIRRVFSTPPLAGSGTVRCAHGEMPVPTPGTAELMRGLPLVLGGGSGERLTPTGAALLAELVESFAPPGPFCAEAIGYAAGHRDPPDGPPNVLRVQLGRQVVENRTQDRIEAWLVELNLDDMTGEEIGYLLARLREAGALDAWTHAVQMKKERPGVVVSALCRLEARDRLERAAFAHSTTLGLRWTRLERRECAREILHVELLGHPLRIKLRRRPGLAPDDPLRETDLSPEYEDLAQIAAATGAPLRDIERAAVELALAQHHLRP